MATMADSVRIIPLGGLGEVGKNMMALECGGDIIVIDAGVMFPKEDMLGVDLVLPDTTYLVDNAPSVRAVVITHGHEDHIGALPYVLQDLDVPVYAPPLAYELVKVKLEEHDTLRGHELHEVQPGEVRSFGALSVEFFRVCHSIPDACGLAIQTPLGTVVHTGDFKIDHTPVDGRALDLQRIGELGREGVLLLLSDSTAAESPGHTPSEQIVSEGLKHVMADAPGRVLVATFASLIARIQQVVDAAVHDDRKVAFAGRSMMNNVKMALSKGYLQAPSGVIIDIADLELLPPERQVIVITGSQGEPTSVLVRIANRRYREITVGEGDTVILSASTIPGNERVVARTLDDLVRQGARVVTPRTAPVHVGGHGSQEELKLMLRLIEPRYFVPVHGEYRMLAAHAELARSVGVTLENVFVLEDGDVLEISDEEARIVEQVPAGHVYVDGAERFDMSSVILRDRRRLAEEGFAVVVIPFDHSRGQLAGKVEVITHGFVDAARAQELSEQAAHLLANQVFNNDGYPIEWGEARQTIRSALGALFHRETGRRPFIIPVPVEV